jgi:hypothetical protein
MSIRQASAAFARLVVFLNFFIFASSFQALGQGGDGFTCIELYFDRVGQGVISAGLTQSEASATINEVAASVGLPGKITPIGCRWGRVEAVNIKVGIGKIPPGEYIAYNADWVREISGKDRVQLVAIIGHELGHFLNRHFGANESLPKPEKEAQADHFAGCAVARMGRAASWSALANLLERLRKDKDKDYPDRLQSLEAASNGFKACGGEIIPPSTSFIFTSYEGPLPNLTLSEVVAAYPNGNWVAASEKTKLYRLPIKAADRAGYIFYYLKEDNISVDKVAFYFQEVWMQRSRSTIAGQTYDGSPERVEALCGEYRNSLLGSLTRAGGGLASAPEFVETDNSANDLAECRKDRDNKDCRVNSKSAVSIYNFNANFGLSMRVVSNSQSQYWNSSYNSEFFKFQQKTCGITIAIKDPSKLK